MADLYYYEEGYIDAKYYVYTADAQIGIEPYIVEGYFDYDYYEAGGGVATLTAELTLRPGETVSATGAWTSEFTQTALVGRLQSVSANFTSAFAPTLTVDAFKNHTAILESTSTFTVDAQANRSANVLLEHIANLNAQAAKTAVVDSTMAIQATTSITAISFKPTTLAVTTNFTFSINAGKLKIVSADNSASFSFYAGRLQRAGRPRPYTQVGTPTLDTSSKKFGTASILVNQTNYVSVPASQDWTRIRTIDFWFRIANPGGSGSFSHTVLEWYSNNTNYRNITFQTQNTGTKFGIISMSYSAEVSGVSYYGNLDFGSGISFDTWRHLRLLDDGSTYTIWIDGTKQTLSAVNYTNTGLGLNQTLKIGSSWLGGSNINIDELLITRETLSSASTTSFTVASDRWYPEDQTKILLLSHYDSDYTDDVGEWMTPTLALSSSATISAQANANTKLATATLNSAVTVTASAVRSLEDSADLATAFTQATSANRTRLAAADQNAETTVTVIIGSVKQFVSDQNALFTPSITVQAQLAGVALLESQFTQTASAVKTTDVQVDMTSTVSVAVSATVTAGLSSDLNTAATISILGYRTRFADSNLNTSTALTCDFVAFNNVSADLVSEVTVTAAVTKLKRVEASVSAEFTQTTSVVKTTDAISTLSSESTLTADNVRIRFADSQQSAEFTQTAQAVKTSRYQIDITVAATQTTAVNFIAENIIPVGSLFEPSINADAQFAGFALLESTSTVTAVIGSIKQFDQETTYYNSGVSSYELEDYPYNKYPRLLMSFDRGAFDTVRPRENGFTLSIWVKRDQIEYNQFQAMVSNQQPSPTGPTAAFTFRGTDVWLRQNYDPDEPNPVWTNVSTDTDWHHYLFYTTSKNEQFGEYFRLWIDGIYQGERQYGATDESVAFNSGEFLLLGYSTLAEIAGGYPIEPAGNDAGFAQIWMGVIPSSSGQNWNPPVDYFYDHGYVELYDDGRGQDDRLPQPLVYNRLDEPWTGVDFYPNYYPQYTGDERPASQPLTDPWHSYFRLHCNYVGVFLFRADLTAQAVMQSTVIAQRRAQADLTSSITINIDADQRIGIVAAITATVTQTASVIRIQSATANVTSTTNIVCAPGFIKLFDADLTAQFTLDCDFAVKPPIRTEANLLSQFTVTADPASFTDSITMMMSSGTLTADATLIPPIRVEADLVSTTTLTVIIGSIEQFAVLTALSGTITITAVKTTDITQSLSTVSTVSATIKHYKGIILTLTAFNTVLTAGDIINLDPYLTLMIKSETRGLLILKETRDITIESETRVNII